MNRSLVNTGQHYKLPPNYVLQGASGQASEVATTNTLGFRGPDFQANKPEGVFRVICMGGSSTFGFHNRDVETYPFQLEQLFKSDPKTADIEVINAGFPHYNTGSILSLLETELLGYEPDLLTLYTAANDTGWPLKLGALSRAGYWIHEHLMVGFVMDILIHRIRATKIYRKHFGYHVDREEFMHHLENVRKRYKNNINKIIHISKEKNIPIILIKQPITTDNNKFYSITYKEEFNIMWDKFVKGISLSFQEILLIRHFHLIQDLEVIAKKEGIELIDNIKIVDQDRSLLASWVHLTHEANQQIAKALKLAIKPYINRHSL